MASDDKELIIIYQTESGQDQIDVRLEGETVWLDLNQISTLFQRDKSVISRHLNNIYKTGELDRVATVAKNATVQTEGGRRVTRKIVSYNLDAIISVGYRVNSIRGTQFRIWATKVLREHLVEGITVDRKRLEQKGVEEARQTLALLSSTLQHHNLVNDEGKSVLEVVTRYTNTWRLLLEYDEDRLVLPETGRSVNKVLDIVMARRAVMVLKNELFEKGEATDGNKRIGSFLFIMFLKQNNILSRVSFDNKALVALTLLTAASEPVQKQLIIRLIVNLLIEN